MTSFIIPSLSVAIIIIWLWYFSPIQQETAVFRYKLRYRWRRFLATIQPTGIDQLDDGIVIVDKDHRVVSVNEAAAELWEQTTVSLIGQPLDTLCPTLVKKFEQALNNKLEVVKDKITPPRTYELRLQSLYNWRQKLHGYMLIIDDVTEQKKLEERRREMTNTMVHDLRAPLSNSIFALQMLDTHLNGQTTPETVKMIEMTKGNTEKVLDRVNKILDIERLEADKMPLAFSAVSLADVVATVLEAQSARITDKEIDVSQRVPDSLAPVWADANLLERVLQNLIDNSIKFTPVGGEVVIETTAVPDTNPPTVLITISDTGTGIPQQLQTQIFDRFSGESEKGGSGLGLAFCKMVLQAHGQDIWVESEPGQGTTFTFSLALTSQQHHKRQPITA